MSATVKIYHHMGVILDNDLKEMGSRVIAQEVTIDGDVFEVRGSVANAVADASGDYQRQLLWENGDGGIADFDVLCFEADADCLLELTGDADGAGSGPDYATLKVEADVPLILTSDELLGEITVDDTVTTMLTIDQIAIQNPSATVNTMTYRLILLT